MLGSMFTGGAPTGSFGVSSAPSSPIGPSGGLSMATPLGGGLMTLAQPGSLANMPSSLPSNAQQALSMLTYGGVMGGGPMQAMQQRALGQAALTPQAWWSPYLNPNNPGGSIVGAPTAPGAPSTPAAGAQDYQYWLNNPAFVNPGGVAATGAPGSAPSGNPENFNQLAQLQALQQAGYKANTNMQSLLGQTNTGLVYDPYHPTGLQNATSYMPVQYTEGYTAQGNPYLGLGAGTGGANLYSQMMAAGVNPNDPTAFQKFIDSQYKGPTSYAASQQVLNAYNAANPPGGSSSQQQALNSLQPSATPTVNAKGTAKGFHDYTPPVGTVAPGVTPAVPTGGISTTRQPSSAFSGSTPTKPNYSGGFRRPVA
jgi:hypothetical protein